MMNQFFIYLASLSLILLISCKKDQTCDLKENDQTKIQNIYGTWKVTIDEEIWRLDTLYDKSGGEFFSVEFLEDGTGRQISNSIDTFRSFTWTFQFDPDKIAIDLMGNLMQSDDLFFEIEENSQSHQKWIETKRSFYPFGPNASDGRDIISIIRWDLKR